MKGFMKNPLVLLIVIALAGGFARAFALKKQNDTFNQQWQQILNPQGQNPQFPQDAQNPQFPQIPNTQFQPNPPFPQTQNPQFPQDPQNPNGPQDPNAPQGQNGQPQYTGILRQNFEFAYSSQHNSQWCWAASIQMVLAFYGLHVSQEEIVKRSYGTSAQGELPNRPGSGEVITANLNNWSVDEAGGGGRYHVTAQVGRGAPPPALLLQEVSQQHPVILAYMSGPNSGHAVVATAASYTPSEQGPIVQSIIVRDPWPSEENKATNGRVEHPGADLARNIANYWIIRVEK
ncbi:MAG: C39 family peptidase [Gemmatimonadota bacterium]|nr:C39 family peptidase [Gemmatimonadota bacterium]